MPIKHIWLLGALISALLSCFQPTKKARSSKADASSKGAPSEVNASAGTSSSGGGEAPYLKRLRVICRKVGIFVRNDIHFAGCTTDSERIDRLKEVLRKAGMKGTALSFLLRPLPLRFCFSLFYSVFFPTVSWVGFALYLLSRV